MIWLEYFAAAALSTWLVMWNRTWDPDAPSCPYCARPMSALRTRRGHACCHCGYGRRED